MKNTLKKALDELNKENPRIDYVRGILEVLIDQYSETITPVYQVTPTIKAMMEVENNVVDYSNPDNNFVNDLKPTFRKTNG